jgi:RND family efflux transporter MFP subunit
MDRKTKVRVRRQLTFIVGVTLAAGCALAVAAMAESSCGTGITEAVFDVTLSMPVPGIILTQSVKEGSLVHTNEVILKLDNRLEELEVERRKLVMENRKADWESTRTVFEKSSSVSRDELLKKEAEYKVAQTEYETAQEQLRRRHLLSPGEGVVAEVKLHVGEACAAYEPVVRVVDTRRCYFISNIEARMASGLKVNQPVRLELEDGNLSLRVEARIVFISPVVDPASGLQKVKALFENADGKVRPGLVGKMFRE